VKNDHADDVNLDRVQAQCHHILNEFSQKEIPPLEGLIIAIWIYETIAEGMLMKTADGKFFSNQAGLLHPLMKAHSQIAALQPPVGYKETP
jgi:hypothetical protein